MNVNKRDRRDISGGGQRTPRSGGRTTAARATTDGVGRTGPDHAHQQGGARARGTREFPTQGSAALRPAQRPDPTDRPGAPRLRVAPPPPVSVPRAPFVGLVLVLVVGGVLGILLVNTKINENAFRLEKLQQQQAKLDVDEQQLKKRIAESEAPGNLTANARKLGLVESDDPAFIQLPDGRMIGVPRPAGGQPAITSQQGTGG
ncbi:hypothetical protein O7606_01015 [Micromonospora sp. WMMD882]|uniref:hypothetical protein n=1 Tax=Micromonospora sp. WMMD882 TaxID=3015151 RepID=UPI00248B3A24|nr:hypothetical protein [Micromonospora sp. WMMD882]WBB80018.1 hypothetical protein O7606_01015 [Micromonospora sp. WMMD882]